MKEQQERLMSLSGLSSGRRSNILSNRTVTDNYTFDGLHSSLILRMEMDLSLASIGKEKDCQRGSNLSLCVKPPSSVAICL
jgi:hypothetical protein